MKRKMILAAMGLALCVGAQAQKPESSTYSLEAQFGIDGTPIASPTIRGRYFIDQKMAVRVQVGFWTDNNSVPVSEPFTPNYGRIDDQTLNYGLGAGIEMHMEGTDRLSPYVGGQFNWNRNIFNQEWFDAENTSTYKPGFSRVITSATNRWGIDLLAGADYYFAQNIYLGVEIGYYLGIEVQGDRAEVLNNQPVNVTEEDTRYDIAPGSVAGLRLGWRF
jgi:outer membrane protein W